MGDNAINDQTRLNPDRFIVTDSQTGGILFSIFAASGNHAKILVNSTYHYALARSEAPFGWHTFRISKNK